MANMVKVPGGTSQDRYQAPQMRLGRSQFDLSKNHKTTFDSSLLIPYFLTEVLPGDTHTVKLNAFVRIFSPLDAPIMDNIHVEIDYFFVPNRIIWDNWEAFLGAHDEAGAQDTDFTIPIQASTTVSVGQNLHYMGVPRNTDTSAVEVNTLPLRAYGLIYDEWYRDQNLIDSFGVSKGNGPDISTDAPRSPLRSAKKHDYFTTALPYLQKGTAPVVALSGLVPVSAGSGVTAGVTALGVYHDGQAGYHQLGVDGANLEVKSGSATTFANSLFVDLTDGSDGILINDLREAAALQRLLERDARGGTRHPEIIRSHFGVDVPDYRTQRPEYLGGGRGYINVSPVANTSATASEDQGQLTGVGAGTLSGGFAKSFVEHGYVLGILRARGELSYSQGLDRMWSRQTKLEFMWPELAQLGEQPIYNREIFVSNDANDDGVFGYQERYAEYRFAKSLITGKLDPNATGALDFWHLSEEPW